MILVTGELAQRHASMFRGEGWAEKSSAATYPFRRPIRLCFSKGRAVRDP